MQIKVQQTESGGMLVELEGPVTRETVPEIRKKLFKIAKGSGGSRFEVSLSGVSFMDTSGIAMLVELLKLLSKAGARLDVSGASREIKRMIQLACLDQALSVRD